MGRVHDNMNVSVEELAMIIGTQRVELYALQKQLAEEKKLRKEVEEKLAAKEKENS